MKRVLIVQRRMTHYRVPLFQRLRDELAHRGIELRIAAGHGTPEEESRGDAGLLPWAVPLPTTYLAGGRICWQPFGAAMRGCDLVVMTAENKLVWNLYPQLLPVVGRVALWGHGANLQGDARSLREQFKRLVAKRTDWWFAYTESGVPLLTATGFPRERVTVLNNSIDLSALKADVAAVTDARKQALRRELGLGDGPVAIFVGSLYAGKCLSFMLEAARQVHAARPDFRLLVLGAGPDAALVRDFARRHAWVCYAGPAFDKAKAEYLSLADVYFNPGLLGLGILDAFALGLPVLTTTFGLSSPEASYLQSGENGLVSDFSVDDFAGATRALLGDPGRLASLRAGSALASQQFSIAAMALRFADGIGDCLDRPPIRFGA